MADITKSYHFDAPVAEVWHALVDAEAIERWGGGPAVMLAEPGSAFSLWAGDIYGTVLESEPEQRLVEEWYGGPWSAPSIATFTLAPEGDGTRLTLEHIGVPDDEADEFDAGWDEYYLGAMKGLLEE